MKENDLVFEKLCHALAFTWETNVITSKEIAHATNLSVYKVRKALRQLAENGFIEKHSEGCPACCDSYTGELIHESYPPRNGWRLTEKGYQTDIYKSEYKSANKAFEEWATGEYNETT